MLLYQFVKRLIPDTSIIFIQSQTIPVLLQQYNLLYRHISVIISRIPEKTQQNQKDQQRICSYQFKVRRNLLSTHTRKAAKTES
jgi:hypothetical protein